jgi:hypothetical protein
MQVGLKYAGTRLLRCDEVVYEDTTTSDDTTTSKQQPAIKELKCSLVDMTDVSYVALHCKLARLAINVLSFKRIICFNLKS